MGREGNRGAGRGKEVVNLALHDFDLKLKLSTVKYGC